MCDRIVELFFTRELPSGVRALLVLARMHCDTPRAIVHLEIEGVAVGTGRPGGFADSEHVDHERAPCRDIARADAEIAESTHLHWCLLRSCEPGRVSLVRTIGRYTYRYRVPSG